jgi:alkylation response protein AidB-like acyl-CoA dehydrogenase
MDFEFSDEQKMLRDTARRLMEKEIIPLAGEYDRKKSLNDKKVLKPLFEKLAPLGYLGGQVPVEAGGAGLSFVSWGILMEELWRAYASLGGIVHIQNGLKSVYELGNPEQRRRFLPPLLRGDHIMCHAITEPNVGSDASAVETMAVLEGDHYVLNGTKTWISNGTISDICRVVAQTKRGSGAAGICHLLVERSQSPYESREIQKMGVRSFPTAELFFDNCRVPKENLLVAPGDGLKAILKSLAAARLGIAMGAVGIGQAAIDASVRYAKERIQFGKPIGSFQLIQEAIADMIAEIEASRLLSFRGYSLIDRGTRCDQEAAVAKFFSTEAAMRVTTKAVQVHGAYGLSEEYAVERYFRDAQSFPIPDGTNHILRLLVARSVLGISAFR